MWNQEYLEFQRNGYLIFWLDRFVYVQCVGSQVLINEKNEEIPILCTNTYTYTMYKYLSVYIYTYINRLKAPAVLFPFPYQNIDPILKILTI